MFLWFRKISRNFLPPVHKADGSKNKIFVGVSGGVDSSVSAAILKQKGYDVTGVFIKTYYPPEIKCDWRTERLDAIRVCEHLGVPFAECNLEEAYKKHVFDYMVESYREGITPNPDIFCNKYVKFGGFLEWAVENGADYVATGHYAQNVRKKSDSNYSACLREVGHQGENFEYQLVMGVDSNKDQTYFLYQLQQHQLAKVIFPIGNISKAKVRSLANKFRLFTATKKDSQGLCFVGPVDMDSFLRQYIDGNPGEVLDTKGRVIGSHQGAFFLTIGQRTGFDIFPEYRSPSMPRMFIIAKDSRANTVTVSADKHESKRNTVILGQVSWVGQAIAVGDVVCSRIRHRGQLVQATLEAIEGENYTFSFTAPHEGVAAGQSLVLFRDMACLGGGIVI